MKSIKEITPIDDKLVAITKHGPNRYFNRKILYCGITDGRLSEAIHAILSDTGLFRRLQTLPDSLVFISGTNKILIKTDLTPTAHFIDNIILDVDLGSCLVDGYGPFTVDGTHLSIIMDDVTVISHTNVDVLTNYDIVELEGERCGTGHVFKLTKIYKNIISVGSPVDNHRISYKFFLDKNYGVKDHKFSTYYSSVY